VNKNAVYGDASALSPGGVRLGAPAMTSRGLTEADFVRIAELLHKGTCYYYHYTTLSPSSSWPSSPPPPPPFSRPLCSSRAQVRRLRSRSRTRRASSSRTTCPPSRPARRSRYATNASGAGGCITFPPPPPPSYAPIPPTMANLSTFRAGPEGGGGGLCFDLRHARLREPLAVVDLTRPSLVVGGAAGTALRERTNINKKLTLSGHEPIAVAGKAFPRPFLNHCSFFEANDPVARSRRPSHDGGHFFFVVVRHLPGR